MIYAADFADELAPVVMRFDNDVTFAKFKEVAAKNDWEIDYLEITDRFHGVANRNCKLITMNIVNMLSSLDPFNFNWDMENEYSYCLD